MLANSLSAESGDNAGTGANGVGKDQAPTWRVDPGGKGLGLADDYDYVMYGKVYKFDGAAAERV